MTVMRVTVGIYHKPYNLKGTVCDGTINLHWARSSEIILDNGFGARKLEIFQGGCVGKLKGRCGNSCAVVTSCRESSECSCIFFISNEKHEAAFSKL